MKKFAYVLGIAVVAVILSAQLGAARVWVPERIMVDPPGGEVFEAGIWPTMVLIRGVQPVVSNRSRFGGVATERTVHRTPFGWEYFSPVAYLAGDGWDTVVGSDNGPAKYGPDGTFYSTDMATSPIYPRRYANGSWSDAAAQWPYSIGDNAVVSADGSGMIYMASGHEVATIAPGGTDWSMPIDLSTNIGGSTFGIDQVSDMVVSAAGEIAVSGYGNGMKVVAWYDYKVGWNARPLFSMPSGLQDRIAVAWDQKGNLAVAYSLSMDQVNFDMLDMATGTWTTETAMIKSSGGVDFLGAALQFDRFNRPVIASGEYLIYDPVPEPATLLLFALTGLFIRRFGKFDKTF